MSSLPQRPHRFNPAKDFFDSLMFALTDLVTVMPRRATINRAPALTLVFWTRCNGSMRPYKEESPQEAERGR
jgi:hypothetical protein